MRPRDLFKTRSHRKPSVMRLVQLWGATYGGWTHPFGTDRASCADCSGTFWGYCGRRFITVFAHRGAASCKGNGTRFATPERPCDRFRLRSPLVRRCCHHRGGRNSDSHDMADVSPSSTTTNGRHGLSGGGALDFRCRFGDRRPSCCVRMGHARPSIDSALTSA